MARKQENKTIDDVKYICKMMPASLGNTVVIELTGTLGQPLLVSLSTIMDKDGPQIEAVVDTSIKYLMQNLSPADRICKMMLNGVSASKAGPLHEVDNFDAHFRGRIFHLWKVVFWSIHVNYRDFFYAANSNPAVSSLSTVVSGFVKQLTMTLSSGDVSSLVNPSTSET